MVFLNKGGECKKFGACTFPKGIGKEMYALRHTTEATTTMRFVG